MKIVESVIQANRIVVFSKSSCPFCVNAKKLLKELDLDFVAWELDQRNDGSQIQDYLESKVQQRTVPNIFVNQTHVGGSSDLDLAAKDGTLTRLLQ